jgi:hypothetical protein
VLGKDVHQGLQLMLLLEEAHVRHQIDDTRHTAGSDPVNFGKRAVIVDAFEREVAHGTVSQGKSGFPLTPGLLHCHFEVRPPLRERLADSLRHELHDVLLRATPEPQPSAGR